MKRGWGSRPCGDAHLLHIDATRAVDVVALERGVKRGKIVACVALQRPDKELVDRHMAVIVQIGRVKPLADLVLVVAIAHGPRLHEQELLEGQLVVAVAVSLRKP